MTILVISREQLNTLATSKLTQIKAQYQTMQEHTELRKLVPCKPFESVDVVMKRYALNLAKIELMGL